MSEIYNFDYYHNCCGPIAYEKADYWIGFFGAIADRIVRDLHPRTVLDAGCAMGYLVAALRDRGVEAYGIDISEYAISKVREDIRPYCVVGSITESPPKELPQKYDLVVTIEVLEHLHAEEGEKAIQNLCTLSDTILFSSTPNDFKEETHVNVQQKEYWACLFAQNGFLNDLSYRPTYITAYASCFVKKSDWLRQVESYERVIARCESSPALKNKEWISKLYFDIGSGMSEEFCTSFVTEMGVRFSQQIILPQGCKAVRFDPVEGMGCLVWNINARTENMFVPVKHCNGTVLDNVLAFKPNDPQIYFEEFDQQYQYFEISAEILPLGQDGWMRFCESVEEVLDRGEQLRADLRQKEKELNERNEEVEFWQAETEKEKQLQRVQQEQAARELEAQQEQATRELKAQREQAANALKEQSDRFAADLEALRKELLALQQEVDARNEEIQDYSNLVAYERQEAAKVAEAYRVISTSTFWKLTKPGRVIVDILKKVFFRPIKKVFSSLRAFGLRETLKKIKRKLTGQPQPQLQPVIQMPAASPTNIRRNPTTGNPVDGIQTILVDEDVKRLNLVTDTIDASSLLGGVATALIVATEFANRYNYELRIITRNTETNPVNYANIMKISGVQPARTLSFYSDYERFNKPVDFRMEISPNDLFFATSWWSAEAIKNTTIRPRFFYIIQEVETFFYNYGGERLLCEKIMEDPNIDYIINSHYLKDYFAENNPHITDHGCYFEPAFPSELYSKKAFADKKKYKLFFYARPNNPRNLYTVGVELLQKAVDRGILDLTEWDVYCVGQNAPVIHFSTGKDSINMGQLSWTEYAKFLTDVDLGLCLMYTPHPSYPPFDVASSGGVVLTNKMLNKQTFDMCRNVIMADLDEEAFMKGFEEAVALAKDMERRKQNYESNTIPRSWSAVLDDTMIFMGEACENV